MSHLFTLTLMDNLPVMIAVLEKDFVIAEDWAPGEAEMRQVLDSREEPLFFISDFRELKLNLDDVIAGANIGSRGQDPIWQHPKIRGVYLISNLKIVELAVKGLSSPVFGYPKVKAFNTVEKALEDIRSLLASEG